MDAAAQNTPANRSDTPPVPTVPIASGLDVYYREDWLGKPWLKPEPVLFIHGVGESSVAWFGWIPRMAQEFRLIRPDLPGFGQSTVPDNFAWSLPNRLCASSRCAPSGVGPHHRGQTRWRDCEPICGGFSPAHTNTRSGWCCIYAACVSLYFSANFRKKLGERYSGG